MIRDVMVTWLIDEILPDEQKNEAIRELVYQRFRELQLEPLTKPQVERLIKRAIAGILFLYLMVFLVGEKKTLPKREVGP